MSKINPQTKAAIEQIYSAMPEARPPQPKVLAIVINQMFRNGLPKGWPRASA